jgi:pilus assembly protein Flp/PilA
MYERSGVYTVKTKFRIVRLAENVKTFLQLEDGPTTVEYAVMLAIIIVVCMPAITTLGNNAKATYTTLCAKIGATAP